MTPTECMEHGWRTPACECLPCPTCGRRSSYVIRRPEGTISGRCNPCWEVECRLADYLRHGGDRAVSFVTRALERR